MACMTRVDKQKRVMRMKVICVSILVLCLYIVVRVLWYSSGTPSSRSLAHHQQKAIPKWSVNDYLSVLSDHPVCGTHTLVILVVSPPHNYERRDAIRATWARAPQLQNGEEPWKTLFVVGLPETPAMDLMLDEEQEKHKDIIRADLVDTYRNLTLKVLLGFSLVNKLCRLSYLLKTDDDCFVNPDLLVNFLVKYNVYKKELYVGKLQKNIDVIRNPKSKWYVPKEAFSLDYYPPYVSGAGYVISYDCLENILNAYPNIPVITNEDAYIGLLMAKIGVLPINSARFNIYNYRVQTCNHLYMFIIHGVKHYEQKILYKQSKDALEQCHEPDITTWE